MRWAWLLLLTFSVTSSQFTFTTSAPPRVQDDVCKIQKNWSSAQICDYVGFNDDACEGGGYLLWSQYVECTINTAARVFVIIGGVIFLLFLFVMISSAADDFFSPNVAAIVAHLKISESVAGVTFMAFGNGAPDIFGSIASVLSSPTPKAGLALGELLGAGIFVTTMVVATIVITSPFEVDAFSTIRDLLFYLVAIGFILFVFIYANQVFIWEPIVYLGVYAVYVVTVIIGQQLYKRRRRAERRQSSVSKMSKFRNSIAPISVSAAVQKLERQISDEAETDRQISDDGSEGDADTEKITESIQITEPSKRTSVAFPQMNDTSKRASVAFPQFSIFPPPQLPEMFGTDEDDYDAPEDDVVVLHGHVYVGKEAMSRTASIALPVVSVGGWMSWAWQVVRHLRPWPKQSEWEENNLFQKALAVVKVPPLLVFKATIPLSEDSWSKPVALLYTATAPMFFLFAVQLLTKQPFSGSPGLWAYALIVSAIALALVAFFTKANREPRYYKEVYSYMGFLMAISWIYFIAAEVVNVVTMIGVVSKLSHEVLGLTILAWSNSIGDLIADVSVVKQGFPRMALAAAIGGPLFNLLMGFGIPFLIAKARGRYVSIAFTPIYHILILFLGISLLTTLIGLFVQRFYLRRPYAFVMISIYAAFLVMVILTETNVVVWGHATDDQ